LAIGRIFMAFPRMKTRADLSDSRSLSGLKLGRPTLFSQSRGTASG